MQGHLREESAWQGREVLVLSEVGTPRFARNGWITIPPLSSWRPPMPGLSLGARPWQGCSYSWACVVRTDEAYRAIEGWGVVFLVGGMLALGRASRCVRSYTQNASDLLAGLSQRTRRRRSAPSRRRSCDPGPEQRLDRRDHDPDRAGGRRAAGLGARPSSWPWSRAPAWVPLSGRAPGERDDLGLAAIATGTSFAWARLTVLLIASAATPALWPLAPA